MYNFILMLKLAYIFKSYNFGLEWWLDLSILNFLPVNPPEESMASYIFFASDTTAKSLCWVLC